MHQILEIISERLPNKIDWEKISKNYSLSEDFIRRHQNELNWSKISRYQQLSEDFIREFRHKIDWKFIAYRQQLSENFVEEFLFHLNQHWQSLTFFQEFSEAFYEKYKEQIYWSELKAKKHLLRLSLEFYLKHKDRIGEHAAVNRYLQEEIEITEPFIWVIRRYRWIYQLKKVPDIDLLRKYKSIIDWKIIGEIRNLPEAIIFEFSSFLKSSWSQILENRTFSEDFLLRISNPDNFYLICRTQPISIKFIKENFENFPWSIYAFNPFKNEVVIEYFMDYPDIKDILFVQNPNLSIAFIKKYKNQLEWKNISRLNFSSFSLEEVEEFENYFDWDTIFGTFNYLPIEIVRRYKHYLQKNSLKSHHDIYYRKKYFVEMIDYLDFSWTFTYQKLERWHLEIIPSQINWKHLTANTTMSDNFVLENWMNLDWTILSFQKGEFISKELATQLIDRILNRFTLSQFYFTTHYNERKFSI